MLVAQLTVSLNCTYSVRSSYSLLHQDKGNSVDLKMGDQSGPSKSEA